MSAWGQAPVSGAWANQVDEEEEANEGQLPPVPGVDKAFPTLPEHSYPSLADGIAIKPSKKERRAKAAPQKMNLSSFLAADKAQQVDLPTAPRERPEGDDGRSKGLGGGFSGYGGDRGGFGRDREEREDEGPSRADAEGDWGSKKIVQGPPPSRGFGGGFGDRERSGGFGSDRYAERRTGFTEGSMDRADTADKWGSKSSEPSTSRMGGSFEPSRRESKFGGFRDDGFGASKADSGDRWGRRPSGDLPSQSTSSGGRPRLNLAPRSADLPPPLPPPSNSSRASEASNEEKDLTLPVQRTTSRSNPFGDAKPVAVKETPVRSQSSATPSDAGSTEAKDLQQSPKVEKPRVRVNPFGDARPREEILKEQEQKQVTTTEDKPSGADEVGTEETSNRREPEAAEKVATTEEPKDVSEKETSSEANGKSVENSESQPLVSFLEKAKAGAQQVTEKVTEAVSKLTTTDSNDQNQQTTTTETSNSKSESKTKTAETPKGDAHESNTLKGQAEKTATESATSKKPEKVVEKSSEANSGTPKSQSKPSEVRSGSSWANIARGPASAAPESQIPA